jgi:hypothetical protein
MPEKTVSGKREHDLSVELRAIVEFSSKEKVFKCHHHYHLQQQIRRLWLFPEIRRISNGRSN